MKNQLNKSQYAEFTRFVSEMETLENEIQTMIDEEIIPELAVEEYNTLLEEARLWIEDIARQMQDHIDNRSEDWLDGDTGQAFQDWQESWDSFEEFTKIDEIDCEIGFQVPDNSGQMSELDTELPW